MITRPFDDASLLSYSGDHLAYEIDMFFSMTELCCSSDRVRVSLRADRPRVRNAMLEASVIHLRNLIDFLYPITLRATDVAAEDFCTTWQSVRPTISPLLGAARKRADKELAHLTTARIAGAPPEKHWDFVYLAIEIRSLLQLFVANARATSIAPNVAQITSKRTK